MRLDPGSRVALSVSFGRARRGLEYVESNIRFGMLIGDWLGRTADLSARNILGFSAARTQQLPELPLREELSPLVHSACSNPNTLRNKDHGRRRPRLY
jgi:hypothetical protein